MPFISSLKESFAIASIQEREAVVAKLATANTEDAYYYQGLVLLQKIHDEINKESDPVRPRKPTSVEAKLTKEMQNLLLKMSPYSENYTELNTRFHLLIYPFETLLATEFMKKGLSLDLGSNTNAQQQHSEQQDITSSFPLAIPSVLEPTQIDGILLLKSSIKDIEAKNGVDAGVDIELLALPVLSDILLSHDESLTDKQKVVILKRIFSFAPSEQIFGSELIRHLSQLWKVEDNNWNFEYLPFFNFTLRQMDQLIEEIPEIVFLHKIFIEAYLEKLVPSQYQYQNSISFWDDDNGTLLGYLNCLDVFCQKLPEKYHSLKSVIKFHKLRVDIVRQEFDQQRLLSYLNSCLCTPDFSSREPTTPLNIPLLGSCTTLENKRAVVQEYFFGLVTQSSLTISIESLAACSDYETIVKPLYAKSILTTLPVAQEAYIKLFSPDSYQELINDSFVKFSLSTVKHSLKRKPEDTIRLSLQCKNIPHLSLRVFQIDTKNYWHLNWNEASTTSNIEIGRNINLDGLYPTWKKDFDEFGNEPAIRTKTTEFEFGGETGIAPEVFAGRGLWAIEFVGGKNQCRAIIQKGYLRHVVKETTAGHLLRILDENGNSLQQTKIWCNNKYYQADENCNILIPYLPQDQAEKTEQILLFSPDGSFCVPSSFRRLTETYTLKADFYINPEMTSFGKKSTVVVTPKLSMNGFSASLSMLEKATFTITATNNKDVNNSTTFTNIGSLSSAICFDFLVPNQLRLISIDFEAKVKALNGKLQSISVNYSVYYGAKSESGVAQIPVTVHLRKTVDSKYLLHVFGVNGEIKEGHEVSLRLKHAFVNREVDVVLKTNTDGVVDLGELKDIQRVSYTGSLAAYKAWFLDEEKRVLPRAICVPADTPFKLACYTKLSTRLYSLFKTSTGEGLIENVSEKVNIQDGYIQVESLPAGKYTIYLASPFEGSQKIKCTVINGRPITESSENQSFWSDYTLDDTRYAKQNGIILHRPLNIYSIEHNADEIRIKLQNWSKQKTFVIVTVSTFMPAAQQSLMDALLKNRSLTEPLELNNSTNSTHSVFLNDKKLSEEYQYILNRSRAEKWAGSNLTKPSLLMYPMKVSSTASSSRHLEDQMLGLSEEEPLRDYLRSASRQMLACCSNITSGLNTRMEQGIPFLNHKCPVLLINVSSEDGTVSISRNSLGCDGTILQIAVFSGEQAISKTVVMQQKGDELFSYNDLRQKESSNKELIRSNVVYKLPPKERLSLNTNELEIIDSFEKLFDTIKIISIVGINLVEVFGFLKDWPSFDIDKKLEVLEKRACYEVNLWLKNKDSEFFDQYVKPAIKTKIRKSFMDSYLADEDVSYYYKDTFAFSQLNIAEKALLATTLSSELAQIVLRQFKGSFDDKKLDHRSDAIFNSILAGSTLAAAVAISPVEHEESDDDMGFGLFDGGSETAYYSARSVPELSTSHPKSRHVAFIRNNMSGEMEMERDQREVSSADREGSIENDDEERDHSNDQLREAAKKLQEKAPYKFIEPTCAWKEATYYNENDPLKISKFWIDYLEHHLQKDNSMFLSENFMYSLNSRTEVLFVASLLDLPFAVSQQEFYTREVATNAGVTQLNICAASSPLLVFYRSMIDSDKLLDSNSDNDLMLGQELFLSGADNDYENSIKINHETPVNLESLIKYSCRIIVSNFSSKNLTCQVTYQIPTGAVPTKSTEYCVSETISIKPYSTWHQVSGTFYFPSAGQYSLIPITVSSVSGDKLFGRFRSVPVSVFDRRIYRENEEESQQQSLSSQSWPTLATSGSASNVLLFLESCHKLEMLDFNLIGWRMLDRSFARKVYDTLSQNHRFYSHDLWKYGIYHQFSDIICELLKHSRSYMLTNLGQVFESPLIYNRNPIYNANQVIDYYPLVNARAHPLKLASPEILNQQFYTQYDTFLKYLGQLSTAPSKSDLVILTLYLILQDRIGDAYQIFGRISPEDENEECKVQIDYITAYFKIRIPFENCNSQEQDLLSVKAIASKYKDFGVPRWRQLFKEIHDLVCEVERGECLALSGNLSHNASRNIQSEPVLEFEIDPKTNELKIQYANIKSIDIKYYEMDIEVMFSSNPFMSGSNYNSNTNYSCIKPTESERIDNLPEKSIVSDGFDDDYDMVGVGQYAGLQTLNVVFKGGNKNLFVEISSSNGQQELKRYQTYFSHNLSEQVIESLGIVRVLNAKTKRPLAGSYAKVYARMRGSKKPCFWKDGYTDLSGVFDYVSASEGNALTGGNDSLKTLMEEKIDKLSILIISKDDGAVVKEVYPPLVSE